MRIAHQSIASVTARITLILAALIALLFINGCATVSSSAAPDAELGTYNKFYVVPGVDETHAVHVAIRDGLKVRGFDAITGPEERMPKDIQVKVTYESQWIRDITWYLLDLIVYFKDPETDVLLASGHSYRPSWERKPPASMVSEILDKIYGVSIGEGKK